MKSPLLCLRMWKKAQVSDCVIKINRSLEAYSHLRNSKRPIKGRQNSNQPADYRFATLKQTHSQFSGHLQLSSTSIFFSMSPFCFFKSNFPIVCFSKPNFSRCAVFKFLTQPLEYKKPSKVEVCAGRKS